MEPFPYKRIVIVGTTSSGKSTLAEQLANKFGCGFIELDALHWEPNWTEAPLEVFRARVETATQASAWIVAGNYHVIRDLIWPKAEVVIWLDYPLWRIFWQLTRRTFSRWWTQELLWGTNRENLWSHFKLWSQESLFHWLFKTYWRRKREYPKLFSLPENQHLKVIRLKHPRETNEWLRQLSTESVKMSLPFPDKRDFDAQNGLPPIPLLSDSPRQSIERLVSEHLGKKWAVKQFRDMNDFSSHPCAVFSGGAYSVFVKLSKAPNGLEQFEVELAGLRMLSELAGVLTPTPIGNVPVEDGIIMVLEAVKTSERTPRHWLDIGRTIARIHQVKGTQYGLETNGYFGPLYQDNRPLDDWPTFYAERRLWPRLMGAINAGHMPTSTIRNMEKLIQRLPNLCGPETPPTLLHGDAQQNNFISTEEGAVVIDPAVYYGNPEMDLAYVDYFQPAPNDVFIGYQEVLPIDPSFSERRDLWRIYGYLAIVEVEGAAYLGKLLNAVQKYL